MNNYDIVVQDVQSVAPTFTSLLGDSGARTFEAEAGFAIQILTANDYALKLAAGNRRSVIDAVTNVAAIGISLNPAKKQAYLVPRDGRICLDISYMGLLDMAVEAGVVQWGQCRIVRDTDTFELDGIDRQPLHRFKPFAKDRGEIVGVYSVVKTASGDYLTHAMAIDEVHAIRNRSSAYKSGRACPWKTDEGEMIKKTCIKQAYKYWPKAGGGDKLEKAIHYLNTQGGEGIEQQAQGGTITATDGAMAALSMPDQERLRQLADDAKLAFESDGIALAFDMIEREKLDVDQKVAFWSVLPSQIRTALKKESKARADAARTVEAQA